MPQSELRLAALRHFTLGCEYGSRAQRVELVVDAATAAWNVVVDLAQVRPLFGPPGNAPATPASAHIQARQPTSRRGRLGAGALWPVWKCVVCVEIL